MKSRAFLLVPHLHFLTLLGRDVDIVRERRAPIRRRD